MVGFDTYIIEKDNKFYKSVRGGCYLIALLVYIKTPEQLNEEIPKSYTECMNFLTTEPGKHEECGTLEEALAGERGDVIFHMKPDDMLIWDKEKSWIDIRSHWKEFKEKAPNCMCCGTGGTRNASN